MLENIVKPKKSNGFERERIDFDIVRILKNNPYELVVEEISRESPDYKEMLVKDANDPTLKHCTYTTWLGEKTKGVLFEECQPDSKRFHMGSEMGVGSRSLYEIEGTDVLVDLKFSPDASRMHFFVEVKKKGNFQKVMEKIRELKNRVEEGIMKNATN